MSPHKENDLLYLPNILEHSGKIWKCTENMTNAEEFYEYNEQLNLNALSRNFYCKDKDVEEFNQKVMLLHRHSPDTPKK